MSNTDFQNFPQTARSIADCFAVGESLLVAKGLDVKVVDLGKCAPILGKDGDGANFYRAYFTCEDASKVYKSDCEKLDESAEVPAQIELDGLHATFAKCTIDVRARLRQDVWF